MNAAPCGSDLTSIGGVPEKCSRISPDLYYTIGVEGELAVPQSGRRPFRPTDNFSRPRDNQHCLLSSIEALGRYRIKGKGEIEMPRSGRRPFRPTDNFSRPRDIQHCLLSSIEALGRYRIKGKGEIEMPRSGRRPFRPTDNFSRPRDIQHCLLSSIEALGQYTTKISHGKSALDTQKKAYSPFVGRRKPEL